MADEQTTTTTQPGEGSQTGAVVTGTTTTPEATKPEGAAKNEGEQPAKAAEPAKPVVPEKYDLKVPEGVKLEPAVLERTAATAKALGLTQEQAQKLLDHDASVIKTIAESQAQAFEQRKAGWLEDVRNAKDIGGDAFESNANVAKRFMDKWGTDTLRTELNATGFGNHPEVVRFVLKLAKAMGEDKFDVGGQTHSGEPKSTANVLYGSST
jgi:hypothetical protein